MRPVAPRIGQGEEFTLAEEQHQYLPITATRIYGPQGIEVVTRWRLTPEERAAVAEGQDLYLRQLTFGGPFQPIAPMIGWQP